MDERYLEQLGRSRKLLLDSSIIIYLLEGLPEYLPVLLPIFRAVEEGRVNAYISGTIESEILIKACQCSDRNAAGSVKTLLNEFPNLYTVRMNPEIAELAAEVMIDKQLGLAESIITATAIYTNCDLMVSNDRELITKIEDIIECIAPADYI